MEGPIKSRNWYHSKDVLGLLSLTMSERYSAVYTVKYLLQETELVFGVFITHRTQVRHGIHKRDLFVHMC